MYGGIIGEETFSRIIPFSQSYNSQFYAGSVLVMAHTHTPPYTAGNL